MNKNTDSLTERLGKFLKNNFQDAAEVDELDEICKEIDELELYYRLTDKKLRDLVHDICRSE